jgi:isopenicillin N synthase-like dioxygenase
LVLTYIDQVTELGKTLCDLISLSLGLEKGYIRQRYLQPEAIALFRCFKYSGDAASQAKVADGQVYGIGEHTGESFLLGYVVAL